MTDIVQAIFATPPLAFVPGGSTTPRPAYEWAGVTAPCMDGEATIRPACSLAVASDGSVQQFIPAFVAFRDGGVILIVGARNRKVGRGTPATRTWRSAHSSPWPSWPWTTRADRCSASARQRQPNP